MVRLVPALTIGLNRGGPGHYNGFVPLSSVALRVEVAPFGGAPISAP
jgi:hypothetical protein